MRAVCRIYLSWTVGRGKPTLSSLAYQSERAGNLTGRVFRPLIDCIFFKQKSHCRDQFERENYPKDCQ
jgi:hypothetical protein